MGAGRWCWEGEGEGEGAAPESLNVACWQVIARASEVIDGSGRSTGSDG